MPRDWPDEARSRLLDLRQGPGAWGYRRRSSPAAEPSCLASLGLLACWEGRDAAIASARRLASIRSLDGSIGVSLNLPEPGWPTPLALLLWSGLGGFEDERSAAVGWLLGFEGYAMVPTKGDPMGHDTSIVGWPWVAGTHSWVEPSAMALLALAREGLSDHPRTREGVRLLVDRSIPGGGWNLGNPVVFGTPLRPLPGPTGLALLAMAGLGDRSGIVDRAIAYLRFALAGTLAPVSLGWGLLGLRAWDALPIEGEGWLEAAFAKVAAGEPRTVELAMLLLARGGRSLELLGVSGPSTDASFRPSPASAPGQASSPVPPGDGPRMRGAASPTTRSAVRQTDHSTFQAFPHNPLPEGERGRGWPGPPFKEATLHA